MEKVFAGKTRGRDLGGLEGKCFAGNKREKFMRAGGRNVTLCSAERQSK
jgi:hypothetical protein